jgi:hypothetical protein
LEITEKNNTNFTTDENKKDARQRGFFLVGMISSSIVLLYLLIIDTISIIDFCIPIILFIISFIVRVCGNKKISNIICIIVVALVFIIPSYNEMSISNYNKQFLKYQETEDYRDIIKAKNLERLINKVIKNNKKGKQVTIIYEDTNYTSTDELKQLLSKLNTNQPYFCSNQYDENGDYIESITLSTYINKDLRELLEEFNNYNRFFGEDISGYNVGMLIKIAKRISNRL